LIRVIRVNPRLLLFFSRNLKLVSW